jgi:hypothetical protein
MSTQTKLQSFFESSANMAISFITGLISQLVIFPLFGMKVSLLDNIQISVYFMVISLVRGYLVRRYFNKKHGNEAV